jgi:anthranilate/para-aminobenzoate synthase component I
LPWADPLTFATRFAGADMALLYSGLSERYTGGTSYLCVEPIAVTEGAHWEALPECPGNADGLPLWIGHLGYGMREDDARMAAPTITLPDFRLVRYRHLFRFDHANSRIDCFSADGTNCLIPEAADAALAAPAVAHIDSNFTRSAYESSVAATVERIHAGDFYQANITRKFYGRFATAPDSWQLFRALTAASPAPYSAYVRHGGVAILSSSPECFLSIDAQGHILTRPIKGSARRSADAAEDARIRAALVASAKNHAENLMIVDLMRNDLSRVSAPQSVRVDEQSALYSYATIHHLISAVSARKQPHISAYDVVRACFPAGSMTGAPKIAAMRWCSAQERLERGVYSGAIGWFGAGDTCDLSVVIRTLILKDDCFEFQVGGGIVSDSTPEDEWRETLAKARGILTALGLSEEHIAAL